MADSPAEQRFRQRENDDTMEDDEVFPANENNVPMNEENFASLPRATAICEGLKLIKSTEQLVRQMKKEHAAQVGRASLLVNAERGWEYLGYRERRNPDNILLALASPKRPACMKWSNFTLHFSHQIRQDKAVLLARLEHVPGFEEWSTRRTFDAPRNLRGDKEVMMALCSRDGSCLMYASKALKEDRQLVMAAVSKTPTALTYAANKLKGDRRIARAALGRPLGIKAFKMMSKTLQEDPKLAIHAIRKSGGVDSKGWSLKDLPEHLLDDEEVVLEAVRCRGGNLRHVTDKVLLEDFDIVYQACSNDGTALEFVPAGNTRQQMLKGNNLMTVLCNGGGKYLSEAPKRYRDDADFILAAVENGHIDKSFGDYYTSDREFFMEMIACSNRVVNFYECLPETLKNAKDVAIAVLKNSSISNCGCWTLVDRHESLLCDKETLLLLVQRGYRSALGRSPAKEAMKDKDFVLKACAIDGASLRYASEGLRKDVDCLTTALSNCKDSGAVGVLVGCLPDAAWDDESLVECIIRGSDATDTTISWLKEYIPSLRPRNIYLACLEKAWPYRQLPYNARAAYENDEEVMLAALKNQKAFGGSGVFYTLGESMRNSRSFLEKAIAIDPSVVSYAREPLKYDYRLLLEAVGTCRSALMTAAHSSSDMPKLVEFAEQVQERKTVADGFVVFLAGIAQSGESPPPKKRQRKRKATNKRSQQQEANTGCHLPILNCGAETGVALKRLIGEFVGIPTGREYQLVHAAATNMEYWGYP
ncbi:expressed unknown protein [Seminavis robusta]|uniref:DUF4116 domain-containing protein n=1 Tax=Seminavis robusta TaxID=568900 RepID=A0A9N8HTW5_9STRA|nr:expressed unknown protein [Seminavis robusta]|eukprot:Sro1657_g289070.1 n/a (761) ;mRNA; f:2521-4892